MFLVRPSAYKDESSISFMLRIANRNGYPNISSMLKAIGYVNVQFSSSYRRATYFESLQMYGIDIPDEFIGIEVPQLQSNFGERLKVKLPPACFRRDCSPICPACLRDGAYARSVWDFRVYTTCHLHAHFLVSQCPSCSNDLSWKRGSIEFCSCGFDLRDAPQSICDAKSAAAVWKLIRKDDMAGAQSLTAFIDACVSAHGGGAESRLVDSFIAWYFDDDAALVQRMHDLSMDRLDVLHPRLTLLPFLRKRGRVRNCAIATLASLETVRMPVRSAATLTDRLTRADTMVALGIGSHQVLNQLNRRKLINEKPVTKVMRGSVYETAAVDSLLRRLWIPSVGERGKPQAICVGLDAIAISALADPNTSAGYSMVDGLTSLRTLEPSTSVCEDELSVLTIPQVARALGVHGEIVRSLIQREYLQATKGTPKYPTVVPRDDFNRFSEKYVFACSLAKRIGSSATRFAEKLYAHGIEPIGGPSIDGLKIYLFERLSINGLCLERIAELRGKTILPNAACRAKFADRLLWKVISLEHAAAELKVRPRDVTILLRKGYLKRALVPDTKVMIDYVNFAPFREKFTDPKMMLLADAAAGCGETIQQFVSRWVKTSLVKPVNMGIRILVPRADYGNVKNLREDHVTAAEVGQMLGIGRSAAINKVKRNVLSGSKIIGERNRLWLFELSDIEQIVKDAKELSRKLRMGNSQKVQRQKLIVQ